MTEQNINNINHFPKQHVKYFYNQHLLMLVAVFFHYFLCGYCSFQTSGSDLLQALFSPLFTCFNSIYLYLPVFSCCDTGNEDSRRQCPACYELCDSDSHLEDHLEMHQDVNDKGEPIKSLKYGTHYGRYEKNVSLAYFGFLTFRCACIFLSVNVYIWI